MTISLMRFIPAALLITAGVALIAVSTFGVFRIRYVLNRLHAAAIGDSLGMPLIAAGLAILYGWSMATVKLLLILALFWLTSPVCSHLLSALEVSTNEDLEENCRVVPLHDEDGTDKEGGDD